MKRALICVGLLLTGCGDREADNAKRCEGYGAKQGSDAYVQCMTQLRAADKAGDDAIWAASMVNSAISRSTDSQRALSSPSARSSFTSSPRPQPKPAVTPTTTRKSFQVPLVPRKR